VSAEQVLTKISYFNDRAQALLFDPNRLAPTYPTAPSPAVPIQRYYPRTTRPEVDKDDYKLAVGGMVDSKNHGRSTSSMRCRRRPDHPSHLRRGLERDRQMVGCAVLEFLRRSVPIRRQIRLVSAARGLLHLDRHGDRAAPADPDDVHTTAKSCRASTASR